jgi:polyferredoxin
MVIGRRISIFLKIPRIRLKTERSNCIKCKRSSEKCPMSLDVMQMVEKEKMENSECILCGECIDNCTKKAIKYTFAK